jgi:hypothetical protein
MSLRRWVGGGVLVVLLALAGCAEGNGPQRQASPTRTTPTASSAAPSPEEAAAQDATTAFQEMLRVTDAASQAPSSRDWEPEIRRYAGDPAALLAVQAVGELATTGLRQEGNSRVDLDVTGVDLESPEGPTVRLTGCYDSQSTQIVDVNTSEAVPPGTPPRYVWDITVIQYRAEAGEPWLVTTLEPQTDTSC